MKSKVKTTVEVKLKFEFKEFKIIYSKLVAYCNFDPKDWLEIHPKTGEMYHSKSPTDEVEEFLMDLHKIIYKIELYEHTNK